MRPLVTLATPVFNAMPYFESYLASVLAQTWRPLEFILVNDGSTDGSADCLERMAPAFRAAGIELFRLDIPHAGQAAAMNAALPHVRGELFTWCDGDDLLSPESIEKKALFLMENRELGMVRSDGAVTDAQTGRFLRSAASPADAARQNIFDALFSDAAYCYAGCYMLRSALLFQCYPEKSMPLSPEGQNLQLLLPAASRSDCGFIPECLHTYRLRPGSHSSRKRSYTENVSRIENFTSLRVELLDRCLCDRELYAARAREMEKEYKRRLLAGALARAREENAK